MNKTEINNLFAKICEVRGVNPEKMKAVNREKCEERKVCIHLLHQLSFLNQSQLCKVFPRSLAMVSKANRWTRNKMQNDIDFKKELYRDSLKITS
jgi:hypothetical protein